MREANQIFTDPTMLADFEAWQGATTDEERDAVFARHDAAYARMTADERRHHDMLIREAVARVRDDIRSLQSCGGTARLVAVA